MLAPAWCRASQSVSITLHQSVHCFLSSLSLHHGSDGVPPRHLPRTFIGETALLIKELIFSLLSLISIVNLKHCEFFKFSSLLSKKGEGEEKKRWEWGIFNRLSSLPRELDFSLSLLSPSSSHQCKEIFAESRPSSVIQFLKHEDGGGGGGGWLRWRESEGREKERGKKNDLMKFRYQLRTNMQNISLEIK